MFSLFYRYEYPVSGLEGRRKKSSVCSPPEQRISVLHFGGGEAEVIVFERGKKRALGVGAGKKEELGRKSSCSVLAG